MPSPDVIGIRFRMGNKVAFASVGQSSVGLNWIRRNVAAGCNHGQDSLEHRECHCHAMAT
eukprot:6406674-Pyramimonas_sp.AAC.1